MYIAYKMNVKWLGRGKGYVYIIDIRCEGVVWVGSLYSQFKLLDFCELSIKFNCPLIFVILEGKSNM